MVGCLLALVVGLSVAVGLLLVLVVGFRWLFVLGGGLWVYLSSLGSD